MDKQEQLLASLFYLFHTSGMQGLGKMPNLADNKIEINLEQAKESIDMLDMLKDKTKGNISDELGRMLEKFLTDLRLNYIDEVNKK